MLLRRLVDYADRLDEGPRFYKHAACAWQIELAHDGTLRSPELTPLIVPGGMDAKGRPQRDQKVTLLVPDISRSSGIAPILVADKPSYVLGWAPSPDAPPTSRDLAAHAAFVALVDRWADTCPDDPIATAIQRFYASEQAAQITRPDSLTASDRIIFSVDGMHAHSTTSAQRFWAAVVESTKGSTAEDGSKGRCLVCGTVGTLLRTLAGEIKATLVPGATQGVKIMSVNEEAFGFNLDRQLGHSPICLSCGERATKSLAYLLASEHTLSQSGQDARTVWWLQNPNLRLSLLDLLDAPTEADVTRLIETLHRPGPTPTVATDADVFYSLTVSANINRLIVRDWIEMPVAELARNLAHWFADHALFDGWSGAAAYQPLWKLALSTGRWAKGTGGDRGSYKRFNEKGDGRPHEVYRDLTAAALKSRPLPPALLVHLLGRVRNDQHLDAARASLLRLCLVRYPNRQETQMPGTGLDPACADPYYVSGRLFAVLDAAQLAAFRANGQTVNASFKDRYFAGAVGNPRSALTSGLKSYQPWLKKIEKAGKAPTARAIQARITELVSLLPAGGTTIPASGGPQSQAMFLLGYHHQLADDTARAAAYRARQAADGPDSGNLSDISADLIDTDYPIDVTPVVDALTGSEQ